MEKISKRIKDPKVMMLIGKILKANGKVGVPQGGLCRYRHNPPYVEIDVMPIWNL